MSSHRLIWLLSFLFILVGCGSSGDNIAVVPDFATGVYRLTPNQGPSTGGTIVTLSGPRAGQITGLRLGGSAVTDFRVDGPEQVSLTTPAHAAGLVDLQVSTPLGTAVVPDAFTYIDATPPPPPDPATPPTVSALQPAVGPLVGRTVIITGTNFAAGTTVNFDGQVITPTEITPTTITFEAPAHAAGTVDVFLVAPSGDTPLIAGGFTYTTDPVHRATVAEFEFYPSGGKQLVFQYAKEVLPGERVQIVVVTSTQTYVGFPTISDELNTTYNPISDFEYQGDPGWGYLSATARPAAGIPAGTTVTVNNYNPFDNSIVFTEGDVAVVRIEAYTASAQGNAAYLRAGASGGPSGGGVFPDAPAALWAVYATTGVNASAPAFALAQPSQLVPLPVQTAETAVRSIRLHPFIGTAADGDIVPLEGTPDNTVNDHHEEIRYFEPLL